MPPESLSSSVNTSPVVDIEHATVANDPRSWTNLKKNTTLALISSAAMVAGLAGNIQNPAVQQMEADLPATSTQFSTSISVFILVQGLMPLIWSAISEIKGRKLVYVTSLSLFSLASIVVALSKNIELVIGFRCLQAIGSSAVITIGAATLADIFEPKERGRKMGIFYMAPLLGPAIGPVVGGGLTTGLGWRAIFWFLSIIAGSSTLLFIMFFHDTFRRERSSAYQNLLKDRLAAQLKSVHDESESKLSQDGVTRPPNAGEIKTDLEAVVVDAAPSVQLSFRDVNPFKPLTFVLRRKNNIAILFASGLLFAFGFVIVYTSSRVLSIEYGYKPFKIGLVLLSYGFGCVFGSLLGGRWSDRELARLKAANAGRSYPEMRLRSTLLGVGFLPPSVVGFGWVCSEHVHVAAICVTLFFCGFFSIWTYTSTLAYIVDANVGRSSSAVATNSAFRGTTAFVATELAVLMQDKLGTGWMYTVWGGLMAVSGLIIVFVSWRGQQWRQQAEEREVQKSQNAL